MPESTESTLVVVPGPKGPRVHRVTCKRAILTEGHSYGAHAEDQITQACGSCKPKIPTLGGTVSGLVDAPGPIEVVDTDSQAARRKAATAEGKALKAWEKAGSNGDRPATPNLDAMNVEYQGEAPKPKVPRGRSPRQAPREVTATTTLASGRLAPGALQVAVAEHIATLPAGDDITPGQVARHLDRSVGAVGNAMARMVTAGTLKARPGSPRRYRRVVTAAAKAA